MKLFYTKKNWFMIYDRFKNFLIKEYQESNLLSFWLLAVPVSLFVYFWMIPITILYLIFALMQDYGAWRKQVNKNRIKKEIP